MDVERRLPVGAEVTPQGTHFRVWAPKRKRVAVAFEDGRPDVALAAEAGGHFAGLAPGVGAGARYKFRLDGEREAYPDPAARFLPDGPHGVAEVVDPGAFRWTDDDWRGIAPADVILYELHVGTFTREGTWAGAIERLATLADLGVTCLEVMPVAEFDGRWNWGYDGVALFAPTRNYGRPDDFRRFVDRAHRLGIAVILDLVYNHLGPSGNYVSQYADTFGSAKHKTDWGEAINFDGDGSEGVRAFFLANARHWIEEYHLDGYRFDATQNIYDDGPSHILAEVTRVSRQAAGRRSVYLINENEPQHTKLVRPIEAGGFGMDALWNDDFHHSAHVALTGRDEAYFTDYRGTPSELIAACKWGYLYQGQIYKWQGKRRGTPGLDLLPTAFVNYIQNHDQLANYGYGHRMNVLSSPAHVRAVTALMLLAPQTPMLFMGQEFACTGPFNYFVDHGEELAPLIREGRKKEMRQFPSLSDPDFLAALPDPSDPRTFENCKLRWSELEEGGYHAQAFRLHKDLIAFRKDDPIFRRTQRRGDVDGAVVGPEAFVLRFFGADDDDRLVVVNLGTDLILDIVPEPLMAPPMGARWELMLSTEQAKYGGHGVVPLETRGEEWRLPGENWRIPGRSTTILRPAPHHDDQRTPSDGAA